MAIKDYLKDNPEESNTPKALESIENEVIQSVIEIDDISTLILFKSNTSLILYTNGAFKIMNIEPTSKLIKEFINQSHSIAHSFNKVSNLLKKEEPKLEIKQEKEVKDGTIGKPT